MCKVQTDRLSLWSYSLNCCLFFTNKSFFLIILNTYGILITEFLNSLLWKLTVNHYKKHNNTEVIKYPFYEIFFLNSPEKKLKLFFKWVCYPYLAQKFRSLLLLCSQDVEHSGVSRKGGMTIFVFLSLN